MIPSQFSLAQRAIHGYNAVEVNVWPCFHSLIYTGLREEVGHVERRRIITHIRTIGMADSFGLAYRSFTRLLARCAASVIVLLGLRSSRVIATSNVSLSASDLYSGRGLSVADRTDNSHSVGLLPVVLVLNQGG